MDRRAVAKCGLEQGQTQTDRSPHNEPEPEPTACRGFVGRLRAGRAVVQKCVQSIARKTRPEIQGALHPAEGILTQREVVHAFGRKTRLAQQVIQGGEGKLVEVTREVEVEPGRSGKSSLTARKVGHRNDEAPSRLENAVDRGESGTRIFEVFEYVPDDDLVEEGVRIAGVRERGRDADLGARVGPARGPLADLDAVHLEAAIGERAEDDTAPATHVEDTGSPVEPPRQERDVSRAHDAHESLDQGLELDTGLPVVFVGVVVANRLRIGHGVKTPESTLGAHHHALRDALDLEAGRRLVRAAHRTGSNGHGSTFGSRDFRDSVLVEAGARRERLILGHSTAESCGARRETSREGTVHS